MLREAAGLSRPAADLRAGQAVGLRAGLHEGRGLCERFRGGACGAELGAERARPSLYLASELASRPAVAEGG